MNNVKDVFSIKDLENLSGIKAHTIRIWEKRYNVLEPMRSDTNIRYYSLDNLQKLLNIVILHKFGYKISKISKLNEPEIVGLVNRITTSKNANNLAISQFKVAMMNFDQTLFIETYDLLLKEKSFRDVFYTVFIPLIEELGYLWQTNTISPAHEHFISYLIKQKVLTNTEKLQYTNTSRDDKTFVLFLPPNEIHELGLMYLNYEIIAKGFKSIYLGESVPTDSLKAIVDTFDNITFVSYITVEPTQEEINPYVENLVEVVTKNNNHNVHIIGRMTEFIENKTPEKLTLFNSIENLILSID
jgi:MerR family transcriptional regulator, light-induced transcriptional regulator